MVFFVRENVCPTCGYTTDAAAALDGSPLMPEAGDASVCFKCGEILEYSKQLKLEKMSEASLEEWKAADIKSYTEILKAQELIKGKAKKRFET